jgi:prepilin-type N-terminal cleavage/methylation domain-containing protein
MRRSPSAKSGISTAGGFSLIELLVTIGVIAILVGIALPSLFGAKRSAGEVVVLSNLRQTAITFHNYNESYRGMMPFAPPGSTFATSPLQPPTSSVTPGFWDLSIYWPSLLHDLAPWPEHFQTWVVPDPRRDEDEPWLSGPRFGRGIPSFEYCRSLFARPAMWSGSPQANWQSLIAPVRRSEVAFPSSKVFLFDGEAPLRAPAIEERTAIAMAFVDGHASRKNPDRASEAMMPVSADVIPTKLHDTKSGSLGVDY